MKPRLRLLARCLLFAVIAAASALLLLTLLHASLKQPSVHAFDLSIQADIHAWTSPPLTRVMRFFTRIGSIEIFIPTLFAAVAILLIIGEKQQGRRRVRKREVSGVFALGMGGAILLNDTFKLLFRRPRPVVPWSIGDEHTYSFPSGHSLFSLVLYGLIAYLVLSRRGHLARRILVVVAATLIVLCIGLSRIYLGMHWPTDVLAGYLTGALWLTAVILIDRRWRTHAPAFALSP